VVGQESGGEFVFAATGSLAHLSDSLYAEAEAILKGISIASDLGIGRAIFETDSELMSSTITSNTIMELYSVKSNTSCELALQTISLPINFIRVTNQLMCWQD
jgi:ribonuclease HI